MSTPSLLNVASVDRPVFVLGERAAAMQLVGALGGTPTLSAAPHNRLLTDLVVAVERCTPAFGSMPDAAREGLRPATWYRDVQAAVLRATGKSRTVEFCGLAVVRLCDLFPAAQFVVVRQLNRAIPRSRRLPPMAIDRTLQVDSESVNTPETLELVLSFLGEPAESVELDLSEHEAIASST